MTRWVAPAAAWSAVLVIETVSIPSQSLLIFLVPPFELGLWVLAVVLTARGGRLPLLLTAILGVHFTNWSAFEPTSYFVTHRYAFEAVASGVRDGSIGSSDAYYGSRLPWHLTDLSTLGRAAVVGGQGGHPAVFLPQELGIPDDAAGYVYFAGPDPSTVEVDLFGAAARLAEGRSLGDGWWYVRPGDR